MGPDTLSISALCTAFVLALSKLENFPNVKLKLKEIVVYNNLHLDKNLQNYQLESLPIIYLHDRAGISGRQYFCNNSALPRQRNNLSFHRYLDRKISSVMNP